MTFGNTFLTFTFLKYILKKRFTGKKQYLCQFNLETIVENLNFRK